MPNNLVPLAAIYGILSLPPRPFCPCLPVYLANLAMLQCYTIGNIWEDGILEHCKKETDTPKYSFTASHIEVGVWADVGRLINKFSLDAWQIR